ncbi:DUF1064 domain-containing protein [Peribacillus frigoritolerans]|uniref:DUF1064 domain-containing protein n=1 Tax=Peribacillus frigoritolerans TaxID=450367 RepID=UPI002B253F0D|nr:DUF1064 domain-containing protein [Peribacillus frigoritolerans]MEB2493964.1 DUF1064 domain-containing protein [Peribacillus frigoritolerans]
MRNNGKINSKKTIVGGIVFDSQTEGQYYRHLTNDPNVKHIELQPKYTLLEAFKIRCSKCIGEGKTLSPKINRMIKCRACEGKGKKSRQPWTYKADFKVTYMNGNVEVIDVKGHANERFPLVKKMWERKYGQELIVVKKVNGKWKRG